MKTLSTLIVAGCMVCAAPLAQACGMKGGPQGGWMLEQMDQNKDGAVSKKEFDTFHRDRFKELDANKDGKVTQDEMDAQCKRRVEKCAPRFEDRFDEVDIDHDGLLSKDEAEIGMPMVFAHFDETDTSKDGKISKEEMKEGLKKMHERMRDMRDKGMMNRDPK
ncbi:MAG: EF-hand domain-containing protein [Nitrosomonadales bacterium]|nr:EF-hand domain-containing protein [Nitrosomonadales bacterium]